MRIAGVGHAVFAVMMIVLGGVGFFHPELVSLWGSVPARVPGHAWLPALMALVSVAGGVGLLVPRVAGVAARGLLITLCLWLLLLRLPEFFFQPLFAVCWSVFPLLLMVAAVLCLWFAADRAREGHGVILGQCGLRMAHILYGLCLIFFGIAHFADVKDTVSLVPRWLPGHLLCAYFTGCAFLAAGLAAVTGVWARLAVTLSAVQIGLFLFLVWVPIVAAGSKSTFAWSELILNAALGAGAWVVAESYRGTRPGALTG